VDVRHGTVGLVADRPVDLAPLAGALAVDLVLSAMVDAGAHGACVRLGPNVRAVGASPHHGGWLAPIEGEAGAPQVLQLQQGAAATVTTRRGSDPGPRMASVVADQAWRAHLLAAAWLRMGTAGVRAMLTDAHAAGRLVRANGSATTAGNWAAFRPTAALC
jgi:thiamine biosynthesis lipoprotein ApbE